ncbi:MAG: thioredoxin domain-containing protein, partial [bacterium]|nr:thioredoxin domain-containing protein [bacterium]
MAHATILSILLLMLPAFVAADESGHRNHLGAETSPYLLQHATNPVWWYPWGDEAFEAAHRENKPIFLSVGYSTCYWCHFMERDSFEKDDVAALLNEHFISIKVDREERPDIDNIYMTALRTINGRSGGWPMSLFLTPDGKPFFGRSTIQHDSFISLLQRIAINWQEDPDGIVRRGSAIARELGEHLNPQVAAGTTDDAIFGAFYSNALRRYDNTHGGFGNSRKFPRPHVLLALLRYYRRSGENLALEIVTKTLAAMAHGGINDILAGGFHRYSTDKRFNLPHFEKMLYDNAGLAIALLEAFQASGDPEMAFVARMTLDWTLAEMTHKEGAFFSAQDAGEFGSEGEYYAWTFGEIESVLTPEQLRYVKPILRISKAGNFDGKNVFHLVRGRTLSNETKNVLFSGACAELLAARNERNPPHLDDKILAAWNGLMIAAMARGYQVLGDKRYLDGARDAADFIRKNMIRQDGTLYRAWREGKASQRAIVNDYAFLIHGLI